MILSKFLQFKDDICAFTGFGDDIQNESYIVKTTCVHSKIILSSYRSQNK